MQFIITPIAKYISEACSIYKCDEIVATTDLDYLDLIVWNDLTLDDTLEFFEHSYDDNIMDQAFDFKLLYIESLKENLDNYINELSNKAWVLLNKN